MRTILVLTLVLACAPPALAAEEGGTALFSKRFGNRGADRGVGVRVDGAGQITIVGWVGASGRVDLGNDVLVGASVEAGERRVFFARFDPRGNTLWGHTTAIAEAGRSVLMDLDERGYLSYAVQENTSFRSRVERLDPSGRELWDRVLDAMNSTVSELRVTAAGHTVIAGYFEPSRERPLDLGNGPLTCGRDDTCGLVAELDLDGKTLWSRALPAKLRAVTTDPAGDVVVGGTLCPVERACGPYLARLDRRGNILWTRSHGDPEHRQEVSRVAMAPDGSTIAAGFFRGRLDLDGGAPLESEGLSRVFVAEVDASGAIRWSRRFGGGDEVPWLSLAADRGGRVFVSGDFSGKFEVDGGALISKGAHDMFVLSLAPDGSTRWSRRYGEGGAVHPLAMAIGREGEIILTGDFTQTVDFGSGPLVSAGDADGFLAALAP